MDTTQSSSSAITSTCVRAVSPTPTEIDFPEPEQIATFLQKIGVKARDFAREAKVALKRVQEAFDVELAFAEYEYRLGQRPRQYPIQGKTLQRLLDAELVTPDEVKQRCHQKDFDELAKVNSRPLWPYFMLNNRSEWTAIDRRIAMQRRRPDIIFVDRVRRNAELQQAREEREAEAVETALRAIRAREEQQSQTAKRPFSAEDEAGDDEEASELKRRRMEEAPCGSQPSQSQSQSWMLRVPEKQYPAPLSCYDPEIYPEAAAAILSQSQSQSQPYYYSQSQPLSQPFYHSQPSSSQPQRSTPTPPTRTDTPPIEDTPPSSSLPVRTDTPPLDEEPSPAAGLQKPNRGLKSTLSRTQTFSQL